MTFSYRRLAPVLLCGAVLLAPSVARAVNLVPNPSFETYTNCPSNLSNLYIAAPWDAPTTGTADYYNACAVGPLPPIYCSVPYNGPGYQPALTGSGYAGIIVQSTVSPNYREYMQAPLGSPLQAGATYNVKFYVSFSNSSDYATNRLGAYCSIGAVGPVPNYFALPFTPQVESPAATFLTDTLNWVPVSGNFVAVGGEDHITIGNFHDDATTTTQATGRPFLNCYYYVEDVSVTKVVQVDQACCLPNGQCILATASECVSYGGTAQGVGVSCGVSPCGAVVVTPVVVDGFPHIALGNATIEVNAATGRLQANNIGGSGQDGVRVPHADGSNGYMLTWGDYDADFGAAGSSHTHALRGTVAGGTTNAPIARLHVLTNADNSETLTPDFSAVHAQQLWVDLLGGTGTLVQRLLKNAGFQLTVVKQSSASMKAGVHTATHYREKSVRLSTRSPYSQSAEVRYTGVVVAQDGAQAYSCEGVRFTRVGGDPAEPTLGATVTAAFPASNGPGSFSFEAEETDPPCTILDCAGGHDTGVSLTALRPLNNLVYLVGGESGRNTPSVLALDPAQSATLRLSLTQCCFGPGQALTLVAACDPPAEGETSGLAWDARGVIAGTTSVVGHATATFSSAGCQVIPDFSSVGASGFRVVLRNAGVVVGDALDPPGGVGLPPNVLTDGSAAVAVARSAGGTAILRITCITHPCPGWPVTMNGVTIDADQIDFEPPTPPLGGGIAYADNITSLDLTSVGFPMLTSIDGSLQYSGVLSAPTLPAPNAFARPQLSPNPAAGPVRVVFALPRAGQARVSVIDATGRLVRQVAQGAFAAGAHSVSWDGREDSGATAPPGIYFVRVESSVGSKTSRITRLW